MYSLFQLLFNRSYWRQLGLKSTWFEAWLSLRRAHKDRRARQHLRRLSLLLVIPVFCLAYLIWLLQTGAIILLLLALPVVWWIRRENRRNEPLHIAPQPERPKPKELTEEERNELCRYLAEFGLFYAVMLDRAGSEHFLKNKELPPNVEIVSRRTHIDLLQRTGIWDKISALDREALMVADGHWDLQMIQGVSFAMEPYRLLRWLLRIDFYLPVIGKQTRGDFGLAHELVQAPDKILEASKLVSPEGLEIALRGAKEYFYRCYAESIHRGYSPPKNEEAARWAAKLASSLAGQQHDDLTIGSKLVSEADQSEILLATAQSHTRVRFLAWFQALLHQTQAPDLPYTLLSSAEEQTATAAGAATVAGSA
jgi:hypothetical protein